MADLKARLCEISWIARKRFWLHVAPMRYAVPRKRHERKGVLRRRYALVSCSVTTPRTTYFVRGSGPQSLVTCWCVSVWWFLWVDRLGMGAWYLWMGLDDGLSS